MKVLIISFLALAYMGCSDGLQTTQNSSNKPDQQTCRANKKVTLNSPQVKVDWKSFQSQYQDGQDGIKPLGEGDLLLPKDFKMILTVSNVCLLQRVYEGTNLNYSLTKLIQPKENIKEEFSDETSIKFQLPVATNLFTIDKLANQDDCILMVSRNVSFKTQALPNDPRLSQQTHLNVLNYSQVYDDFFQATSGIKNDTIIAIIDNGVDINHEDLKAHLWENSAEKFGNPGIDDDSNGYIDDIFGYDFATRVADPNHKYTGTSLGNSHGSHVAGLAAAVTNNSVGISGVMAKNAKIMSLNVFGDSQGASTNNIDEAIRYAADKGAHVINMSLGGRGATASTERAIQYAIQKGAFVVVAAGNDSTTLTSTNFYTPASYGATNAGMVTVGATDSNPSSPGNLCSFSNRSTTFVEIGAPGCETGKSGVLSLLRNNGYGLMQGTSMASPVAAGVAAVVFSYVRDRYGKTLSPQELETLLREGSKNLTQLGNTINNGKNTDLLTLKDRIIAQFGTGNGGGSPSEDCK
jgi:hypothetical protein